MTGTSQHEAMTGTSQYESARVWLRTPPDSQYTLLLAELMAVKAELAALRDRMDEIDSELHETWLGGTD